MKLRHKDANATELHFKNGNIFFFSYDMPGAARINSKYYKTSEYHSATTRRHINVRDVGMHRADEANVVGDFAVVRNVIRISHATLAVLPEGSRAGEDARGAPDQSVVQAVQHVCGHRLAVVFLHRRLGVHQVEL